MVALFTYLSVRINTIDQRSIDTAVQVGRIDERLQNVEADLVEVKQDVADVKQDVADVKQDVGELKQELAVVKSLLIQLGANATFDRSNGASPAHREASSGVPGKTIHD